MNHKRTKPKRKGSCGLCKPWKRAGNGKDRKPITDRRRLQADDAA